MEQGSPVIVGAGPYGLAIAAHMKAQHSPVLTFGKPMEFWRNMPPGMSLKSTWSSVSIEDPAHTYTFDHFCKLHAIAKEGLVPVQVFLKYAQWFQEQTAPDIDQTYVSLIARDGRDFRVELADGRSLKTGRVIIATGLASFARIPDFAAHLPTALASHTQQHSDFSGFKGKSVVVVGSGQSAFEASALLYEAGASVELIARGQIIWINRKLYRYSGPAKRLFYPPSDIGPAGISWIVAFPMYFRHLPEKMRIALDTRSVRPAGAPWMRPRIEGKVSLTPNTSILSAAEQGGQVHLRLSNETTRRVDHLFLGTGYQPDVQALTYLEPALRQQVQQRGGYPFLNQWFESSVPNLYFVGNLSAHDFGPLCRHICGTGSPARQITQHILQELRN